MTEDSYNMFDQLVHNARVEGALLAINAALENGVVRGQESARKAFYSCDKVVREALDKRYNKEIRQA